MHPIHLGHTSKIAESVLAPACAIHPYLAASGDTYEQEATASLALRTPRFAGDFLPWVVLATICLALPSGILMAVLWHREICI